MSTATVLRSRGSLLGPLWCFATRLFCLCIRRQGEKFRVTGSQDHSLRYGELGVRLSAAMDHDPRSEKSYRRVSVPSECAVRGHPPA